MLGERGESGNAWCEYGRRGEEKDIVAAVWTDDQI